MTDLLCSKCGKRSAVEVLNLINVGSNPELREKVKDGSLFVWECPHCGTMNLKQSPVLYHDPSGKLLIWLKGDSEDSAGVEALFESEDVLKDYSARLVGSVGELIEKVKIFDAGLDDVIVEMTKYVSMMEMEGKPEGLKFVGFSGADSEMTFTYPSKGQMEMIGVGFNVYEDCSGIVGRNPVIRDCARGLVRIDNSWISQFFK